MRHVTMDQGGEASGALDAPVVSSVPGERGPVAAERTGVQPGQSVAAARAATAHRELVAHQSPAAPRQDGWTPRTTRAVLLLALPGGESPDQALVRVDAPADLGTARADGLTQDPANGGNLAKQRSASGLVSRRCAEVVGRQFTSRLEVLPWADFEAGRNATK